MFGGCAISDGRTTHNRTSIEIHYRSCVSNEFFLFTSARNLFTDEGARIPQSINNKNYPALPQTAATAPERFLMESYLFWRAALFDSHLLSGRPTQHGYGPTCVVVYIECVGS